MHKPQTCEHAALQIGPLSNPRNDQTKKKEPAYSRLRFGRILNITSLLIAPRDQLDLVEHRLDLIGVHVAVRCQWLGHLFSNGLHLPDEFKELILGEFVVCDRCHECISNWREEGFHILRHTLVQIFHGGIAPL